MMNVKSKGKGIDGNGAGDFATPEGGSHEKKKLAAHPPSARASPHAPAR
jgi:hypothetical protein